MGLVVDDCWAAGVCALTGLGVMAMTTPTPRLPDARARVERLIARYDMTATERYEIDAEAFYAETGFMAPGKDVPMAMGGKDEKERRSAWDQWVVARNEQQKADLLRVLAELDRLPRLREALTGCGGLPLALKRIVERGRLSSLEAPIVEQAADAIARLTAALETPTP